MSEIKTQPIQHFLNELASKSATPGGGSAAAIMGAQGAALISMVCNLTIFIVPTAPAWELILQRSSVACA